MDPFVLICAVVVVVAIYVVFKPGSKNEVEEKPKKVETPPPSKKVEPKQPAKTKKVANKKAPAQPTNPLLKCTLKGHTGTVTSLTFPADGKHLCSTSEDRSIRFWPIKDFSTTPTFVRFNIEFDHAVYAAFSPDVKACVVATGQDFRLKMFKLDIKKRIFEHKHNIPNEETYDQNLVGCGFSVTHPELRTGSTYVMGCTRGKQLDFRTIGGECLKTIDTKAVYNTCARASPNGRFVIVPSYLGSVPFFEVYSKGGKFSSVERVTDLAGHSAEVENASFSNDSNAVVTISKDGTWVAHDIDVEFNRNADAKVIGKGKYQRDENAHSVICISPNHQVVAVGSGRNLFIYSTKDGQLQETVLAAHAKGSINSIEFDAGGEFIATSGGYDKKICVWHNVLGHRQRLEHLQKELKRQTNDTAQHRLKEQILQTETKISECC